MAKPTQKYPTAKAMVLALACETIGTDYEGREVGLTYDEMLRRVRKAFPRNTYGNSHCGKPIRLNIKTMREHIYNARAERTEDFLKLPFRPRSPRRDKQTPQGRPSHDKQPEIHTTNEPRSRRKERRSLRQKRMAR